MSVWTMAMLAGPVGFFLVRCETHSEKPAPSYAPTKADAFLASNEPDRFAWQLFCAICAPAENEHEQSIMWETWPEQHTIFADPHVAPKWPSNAFRKKTLHASKQHDERVLEAARRQERESSGAVPHPRDGVANEEVRDNKDAFDFIVANHLWFKEGIVDKVRDGEIDFPSGAIAIKGKWKEISEQQKERFHWHEYTEPKTGKPILVGLVALHIASKILPNWHWSTFEQVDNPGLADYIGVHDRFGLRPSDLWPNRQTNQGYSEVHGQPKDNAGVLTEDLKAMMKQHKLGRALSNYYRLKGAQIDFTDRTGRATIVGNSITEAGFVSTASCITCHARASIGAPSQGQNHFPVPPALSVFTDRGESYNGVVDPNWFWDPTAINSSPPAQPEAYRRPLGFLWQLNFMPKARTPAAETKKIEPKK